MFCRKCGTNIPDDSQFCPRCGIAVVMSSPESIPPPESATIATHSLEDPTPSIQSVAPAAIENSSSTDEAQENKPVKPGTSRWARLGIFLSVALTSVYLASIVFLKAHPSAADLTEKLTKASLSLGLAAWGLSEAVAGRWLTIKRTCIIALGLYTIAFISIAIFLGKPLATSLAELNEEQAQLDKQFMETTTGKKLLQPQSFASPQVAATSLAEFERYADATEMVNRRKGALLLDRDDPSVRGRWVAYFEATRATVSETKELYRFAADPSQQVHVSDGVVIIADPDGYNKRMDAVTNAAAKLNLATAALGETGQIKSKDER